MVHDYNNDGYKGVKQAVKDFCKKYSITVLPIPDNGGSCIIMKNI